MPKGEKTTQRQLGRFTDEQWEYWQQAAAAVGLPMSKWATVVLDHEADRILKQKGKILRIDGNKE